MRSTDGVNNTILRSVYQSNLQVNYSYHRVALVENV